MTYTPSSENHQGRATIDQNRQTPPTDPNAHRNRPGTRGLARLVAATTNSWRGLRAAWRMEEAFRQETTLALLFLPLALLVGANLTHTLILVMTCALVIFAELINTAIESIVDRIGPERDPLSGLAKDLGSAVVFVTLMLFLAVWLPSLWQYVRGWLAVD
jgi:diacylglycerol kinase (ATP)